MEYVAQLPNVRRLAAPLVALVIGAAGAVGAYALIDDSNAGVESTRVIVTESPAAPSAGVAKDEARTAAAIAGSKAPVTSVAKDEAKTAAAIGGASTSPQETREQELRTDPHGQKAFR